MLRVNSLSEPCAAHLQRVAVAMASGLAVQKDLRVGMAFGLPIGPSALVLPSSRIEISFLLRGPGLGVIQVVSRVIIIVSTY